MAYRKFRHEVAYYMKRLCNEGLTTSSGGNISLRYGEIVLITPRTALKKRASKSVYSINKSFFESQHIMNLNLKLGAHQIKNGDEEMV